MYGFQRKALNLLRCYLTHRTQSCQLASILSVEKEIICGIPQGSILGPLLFIMYINDLPSCLERTTPRMFADDTNLTAVGRTISEAVERASVDMRNVQKWLCANIAKTEYVLIGTRHKISSIDTHQGVKINNQLIKKVKNTKALGVELDENLSWEKHINHISSKISSGIGAIRKMREYVEQDILIKVYNALIQPYFDYCCEVWDTLNKGLSERLQKFQNRAARLIMNLKNEHGQSILARKSLGWVTLEERRAQMKARLMYKTVNGLAPQRLCEAFQNLNTIHDHNQRGSSTRFYIPRPIKNGILKKKLPI